jgi:transcriptional regulator with XRE-family HTH domain
MTAHLSEEQRLGAYLRDRRGRLDPASFGFPTGRRRTPGLRREEVAQRANISPTWYTWLEQGRGGAPSAEVLNRIARALMLTDLEREHLFVLGLGRPPERRYRRDPGVTPRLQRVLDALEPTPALIRTATWDVVAWNAAATVLLTDFAAAPPERRNMLRYVFTDPGMRQAQQDWRSVARVLVSAFRVEAARAGADEEVRPLVEELRTASPEFRAMWDAGEVLSFDGEMVKHLRHPLLGEIAFEHSAFAVDGRPDLTLLIYNPATDQDAHTIRAAVERAAKGR